MNDCQPVNHILPQFSCAHLHVRILVWTIAERQILEFGTEKPGTGAKAFQKQIALNVAGSPGNWHQNDGCLWEPALPLPAHPLSAAGRWIGLRQEEQRAESDDQQVPTQPATVSANFFAALIARGHPILWAQQEQKVNKMAAFFTTP